MATTFKSAWQHVQKTGDIHDSTLFASSIYTPQQALTSQRRPQTPQLTPSQQKHRQVTYQPQSNPTVWPELAGHSSHRTPGVSQIVMEANSKHAQQVFSRAEYTLSRMKEKW